MGKGFTLVELAIVLVIIGLLIGGVLVAQSMIGTARIQKAVRLLAQCDIAITNFRAKYNQLPGDSNLFSQPGDNNGDVSYGEVFDAWVHLSQSEGLKNSAGTDYQHIGWSGTARTNLNCPDFNMPLDKSVTGQRCLIFKNIVSWGQAPMIAWETGDLGTNVGAIQALYPVDQFAIDKKIDDGNGNTGGVIANWNNGACVDGNGIYQVSTKAYVCSGFAYLGAATHTNDYSR